MHDFSQLFDIGEKRKKSFLLDMDFQKSIEERRQRDTKLSNANMPYEILTVDTADYPRYSEQLSKIDDIVIIDLPGRLDDETLFRYSKMPIM